MRIVFLSTFAFDANVSLVHSLNKQNDAYFITEAMYEVYNYLDKEQLTKLISNGTEVKQLQRFKDLIPLEKTFVVKGVRNSNIPQKINNSFKIHKLVEKIDPDVVLVDSHMLTYAVTSFLYRKKTVLLVHDPFLHSGEKFFIDNIFRRLYFSLIKTKILLNKNQKAEFINYFKQDESHVFTSFLSIYNYLTYFSKKSEKNSGSFNVLFFGRISPYKGLKYLFDAFSEILQLKEFNNITLTVAGSGNFDFDIKPYTAFPQIKIINEFVQPDLLAELVQNSSVVICPYTDATQSGVVMSAYAFKKPVIATRVGGLPEMVDDGITGLLIAPKDSRAIKEAVLKLYNHPDLLQKMEKNIEQEYYNGEKSWDNAAEQFIKVFNIVKQ